MPITPLLFPTFPPHRTRHRQSTHEARAHSDGGSDHSSFSRNRKVYRTTVGGRPGSKGRGASRGGKLPDAKESDFVRRFSGDEDRVRHRTTTSDSEVVARRVAPRVSVPEQTTEGDAEQSGTESGELSGRDSSGDEAEGQFSSSDESDDGEVDSDDSARGDSPSTADGNGDEACTPKGSKERAAEDAQGDYTGEASPATTGKSTLNIDVSRRSATRSPSSTSTESVHRTERGRTEELEKSTADLPALSTTRAESVESPHSTDLSPKHETEAGSPRRQNHVPDHATSAVVAGERQGEPLSDGSHTQDDAAIVGRGYREGSVHESAPAGDGSAPGVRRADNPMVDACVVSSVEGADEDKTANNGATDGQSANTSGRGFMEDLCNVDAVAFPAEEEEAVACGEQKGAVGACSARGEGGGGACEEGALCKDDRRYTNKGKTGGDAEGKGCVRLRTKGTRRRRSPSPPTPSLPSCTSSALRLQENSGASAPVFGSDPLFDAPAHRQNKPNAEKSLPGSKTQVSPVFDPLTQNLEGARFAGDAPQNPTTSSPPRGTKRKNSANITLAQVIDHHMARRRLNGVAGTDGGLPAQRDSLGRSTPGDTGGAKRNNKVHKKLSPTARKQLVDGSAVVAAAWANGCVLPLTATAAPHMRMLAPLLAAEPEGRRIVVRTASAVAAGAAVLALPGYRLEVTGVCRDGLLVELSPKTDLQGEPFRESGQPMPPSTLASRLQAAFDEVVALDLEFDTVRLPHAETLDAVPPGSSSGDLLKWRNDGTAALLYLARALSKQTGLASGEQRNGGKGEGRERLSQLEEGCFLGVDSEMGPLLPRTGLLECFNVEIHLVPFPPSDYNHKDRRGSHSSTVHLAMILSDTGVFRGGNDGAGSSTAHGEEGGEGLRRSTVATTTVPGGAVPNAAARSLRQLGARLCCVPPTRTEGGVAWREIMGLKCVAEVSRLAFASKMELEGKIQLVEGLHTAQVRGKVSSGRSRYPREAGCPLPPAARAQTGEGIAKIYIYVRKCWSRISREMVRLFMPNVSILIYPFVADRPLLTL